MKIRFTLLFLLMGLLILPSCFPEFNTDYEDLDDKWKPGYAVPLLDVGLTLQDALDNFETGGFVTTDPDNLVVVVYRGNRISISGGQFLNLPDVQLPLINNTITVPVPFPAPTELDNIKLKEGNLIFSVSSIETQSIAVDFSLPDFTIGGLPYTKQYTIPASDGSTPSVVSDTVNMFDMNLSFTGGDFRVEYIAIRADGQNVLLPNATLELLGMDYSYIDGYLGNPTLNFAAGLNTIDLFKNWNQGNIQFEEPKVNFTFNNSFGVPIRLQIDSFSINTHFNGVTVLQSPELANGINLGFPSLAQAGQFTETTLTLDETNSNINDAVSNVPYEFYYNIHGDINPDNNTSETNFITDTSRLEVSIDIELPLHGSASLLSLKDTSDFDFSEYNDFDRMKFRSNSQNGFPFDVRFQAYFLDSDNNTLDSLFIDNSPFLAAATVDANGVIISPTTTEVESEIGEVRYSNLKDNAKKMVIVAYLNTANGGNTPVKIFTDQSVLFRLGAIIGI